MKDHGLSVQNAFRSLSTPVTGRLQVKFSARRRTKIYTWTNESDFAFQELAIFVEMPPYPPNAEFFKTDPTWDPIRKDPDSIKLIAQLARHQ
jgi:hypothetical protein